MKKSLYSSEAFNNLRQVTLKKVKEEIQKRLKANPHPTDAEIYIGAFAEELESQVRDTIFEFYKKGYSTESSGFGGDDGEIQSIDGYFFIDAKTREKLYQMGISVCKGIHVGMPGASKYWTEIRFYPGKADLKLMKNKWQQIIKILPKLEKPALPSISGASEQFRQKYASKRTDVEKLFLEKRLKMAEFHPDYEKKFRKRLKELQALK